MKNSLEIRLKEQKEPTIWGRLVQWLHGKANAPVPQLPKTGTHTDILLSQTQRTDMQSAVDAPIYPTADTTYFTRRSSKEGGGPEVII